MKAIVKSYIHDEWNILRKLLVAINYNPPYDTDIIFLYNTMLLDFFHYFFWFQVTMCVNKLFIQSWFWGKLIYDFILLFFLLNLRLEILNPSMFPIVFKAA